MKKTALIIFILVCFSSCKEGKSDLPAEYDFIKGKWEAYETEVSTIGYHGGYIETYSGTNCTQYPIDFINFSTD